MKLEYKKRVKNTLVDTNSILIEMDPSNKQDQEFPGHEFAYYVFKQLPEIDTHAKHVKEHAIYAIDDDVLVNSEEVHVSIPGEKLHQIQQSNEFYTNICKILQNQILSFGSPYFIKDGLFMRYVTDSRHTFETISYRKNYGITMC